MELKVQIAQYELFKKRIRICSAWSKNHERSIQNRGLECDVEPVGLSLGTQICRHYFRMKGN